MMMLHYNKHPNDVAVGDWDGTLCKGVSAKLKKTYFHYLT